MPQLYCKMNIGRARMACLPIIAILVASKGIIVDLCCIHGPSNVGSADTFHITLKFFLSSMGSKRGTSLVVRTERSYAPYLNHKCPQIFAL